MHAQGYSCRKSHRYTVERRAVKMRKKTGRRSAAELAAEFFDIPGEAAGASRVTITGCSRVQIENHRGIAE